MLVDFYYCCGIELREAARPALPVPVPVPVPVPIPVPVPVPECLDRKCYIHWLLFGKFLIKL